DRRDRPVSDARTPTRPGGSRGLRLGADADRRKGCRDLRRL
ncbi:MAG: hypothetical protein AVDCRST_MAG12-2569, partial [uncultured Rubrobacteraceae bacterium]